MSAQANPPRDPDKHADAKGRSAAGAFGCTMFSGVVMVVVVVLALLWLLFFR